MSNPISETINTVADRAPGFFDTVWGQAAVWVASGVLFLYMVERIIKAYRGRG